MASERYAREILALIGAPVFLRATFGGAARRQSDSKWKKAVARVVELRDGRNLQVSRFDGKKDLTANFPIGAALEALREVLAVGFANVHVTLQEEEVDVRLSKNGAVLVTRRTRRGEVAPGPSTFAHDRTKALPLPEGLTGGRADQLLLAMGVVDRGGRVRPTMRAKFTQINEFLKLLEHVLPEALRHKGTEAQRELTILDCGCGASHLTLAMAYYLNRIKAIPARVIGIDINEEVIARAKQRAGELEDLAGLLEFRSGAIGDAEVPADIVLALHACDTATDDALARGIKSGARLILAVPCCHKDLNARLRIAPLDPIHRHGILHERLADLVTDTFRALLLKVMGYRAEVIEFISPEHTARNLMIRAVKVRPPGDRAALAEYRQFRDFIGATPHLQSRLNHAGIDW